MAKRGRPSKKDVDNMERKIRWSLDPETWRSIIAVLLVIIGFILLLSIFGGAGALGDFVLRVLRIITGYLVLILPLFFLAFGIALFFPQRFALRAPTFLGTAIFIVILASIIQLFVPLENSFKVAQSGGGGGMIGFFFSYIFLYVFNFWATLIIFLGILIISVLIALNVSLRMVGDKFREIGYRMGIGDDPRLSVNQNGMLQSEPKRRWFSFGFLRREKKKEPPEQALAPPKEASSWQSPPLDLLDPRETQPAAGDVRKNVEIIRRTLENFSIEVKMGEVNVGPTVAQYTLKPETGVKLNQIVARQNDLSLALAAHPIRIEAPIPGKDAVGIEVPNKSPAIVRLRPMLEGKEFKSVSSKSSLMIASGRDVSGQPIFSDLTLMPHLLIAGATGSGKSVAINGIITTFLYNNSPAQLRIILVDPKRVEFTQYNGVPHLLTPVVTRHEETISALRWAVKEMDDRYNIFQQAGKRDINSYNQGKRGAEKMPFITIFIDELADLMAVAAREVEASIVRLAQLARATGIHLVVATQRPSVDVITGLIKANITNRMAFAVASQVDSRTILDMSGAERLLGNGDMLFLESTKPKPRRIQGVFVSDTEIHKVTGFLRKSGEAHYQEDILSYEPEKSTTFGAEGVDDDKFNEAVEVVLNSNRASASLLQRYLRVGYARAARLLDVLEEQGIVGPSDGTNRSREVLIDKETYDRIKEAEKEEKTKDNNRNTPPSPPPSNESPGEGSKSHFADYESGPPGPGDIDRDIDMGEIDN